MAERATPERPALPVRLALPALACLGLLACQVNPTRTEPRVGEAAPVPETSAAAVPVVAPQSTPAPAASPPRLPSPPPAAAATPPEPSTWEVLRGGFALPGCDYAPAALGWTRRYAGHPRRFAATLDQMLPALDWTARRVAAAGLPTELALLPIVESHFRPHPGPHARPAGIWQMVAGTARSAGVRIDPWFDGRLNLAAATDGAIVLFDRYLERFNDDWRLALVAYNAGEYRVRKALERHPAPGPALSDLASIGLPSASMDYIARLLALACLVRDPGRFDLDLPTLEPERRLADVELADVAGSALARALSGLPRDHFEQVNAGLMRGRTPPGEPFTLLVAQQRMRRVPDLLAQVPARARIEWHHRRLADDEEIERISARSGVPVQALLALNGLAATGAATDGRTLWLPGDAPRAPAAARATPGAGPDAGDAVHVVRSGESLWTIARRHGLTVADLLRYNRLDDSRIRPGQRLLLQPP